MKGGHCQKADRHMNLNYIIGGIINMRDYIIYDEYGVIQTKFVDDEFLYFTEKRIFSGKFPKTDFDTKAKMAKMKEFHINPNRCIVISDNLFTIKYVDRFRCTLKCIDGDNIGITRKVPTITLCEYIRIRGKYSCI